jgi:hypothetical protein
VKSATSKAFSSLNEDPAPTAGAETRDATKTRLSKTGVLIRDILQQKAIFTKLDITRKQFKQKDLLLRACLRRVTASV